MTVSQCNVYCNVAITSQISFQFRFSNQSIVGFIISKHSKNKWGLQKKKEENIAISIATLPILLNRAPVQFSLKKKLFDSRIPEILGDFVSVTFLSLLCLFFFADVVWSVGVFRGSWLRVSSLRRRDAWCAANVPEPRRRFQKKNHRSTSGQPIKIVSRRFSPPPAPPPRYWWIVLHRRPRRRLS